MAPTPALTACMQAPALHSCVPLTVGHLPCCLHIETPQAQILWQRLLRQGSRVAGLVGGVGIAVPTRLGGCQQAPAIMRRQQGGGCSRAAAAADAAAGLTALAGSAVLLEDDTTRPQASKRWQQVCPPP
jgi:hypothetical protein